MAGNPEKYCAIYMPGHGDDTDPSCSGFDSEEEAWEWITNYYLCEGCRMELAIGGAWEVSPFPAESNDPRNYTWYNIDHPSSTSCGAEWDVCPESDFTEEELPRLRERW